MREKTLFLHTKVTGRALGSDADYVLEQTHARARRRRPIFGEQFEFAKRKEANELPLSRAAHTEDAPFLFFNATAALA
jgi:hypothetical protein